MKNCVFTLLVMLCSFAAYSQCYPTPIYGITQTQVGDTVTLTNSLPGGVWSVSDSNIAIINASTGKITGRNVGEITITYNMPSACRLFYSTKRFVVTAGIRVPDNVCAGNTATITDSISTSGTWSSADTGIAVINPSTGVLRGVSTGIVGISYSFTSFGVACTSFKLVNITRGITGRKKLCLADVVAYTDTVTGGRWHIADTNIAVVDSLSGLVRAKTIGMTFITYTNLIGGRTCSAFDTIWVSKGLRGNRSICFSDSTIYYDSVSGGSWSSSDTSVATVNPATGLVRAGLAGTAAITYTITTMGMTFFIADSIHVTPPPTLAHLTSFSSCPNNYAYLPSAGVPVSWSSSDPTTVDLSYSRGRFLTRSYSSSPIPVTLVYTSDYCSYVSDSLVLTVNPRPDPGSITRGGATLCQHDTIALGLDGVSGGTWYSSGPATISSTGLVTALTTYTTTGVYVEHTTTNTYGCSSVAWSNVIVSAAPNPGTITGLTTLNIGLIGNFRGTGSGDTDTWSVSPSTLAAVSYTGQLTPLAVGTVNLKHIYYNSCGSDSVSATITLTPPAIGAMSSLFTGFVNSYCASPEFGVSVFPHSTPYKLKTFYGEGNCDSMTLAASSSTTMTTYNHSYPNTGTYSIKQVLYSGSTPLDSVAYSYLYVSCNSINLDFFVDNDHDCAYTPSVDRINYNPMRIIVDSNGVSVDTLSVTSGLYYEEWGNVGDIYSFRFLSPAAIISCPASGIVYDTLLASSTTTKSKNIGFTCTSSSFDVTQVSSAAGATGRHNQIIDVHVGNTYCAGEDGVLIVNYDSRFGFRNSTPYPSSITGTTLRWNFTNISNITGTHPDVRIDLETPGTGTSGWLMPGTPVYTSINIIPTTGGDIDTTNNQTHRVDTVKSSYDPNMILVTPSGNILNGTKLHYTIQFENDGNDTAHNIYVMDTLPDYVNVSTLQIVMATARMNTSIIRSGGHNIVKFDFPHIMLPDSSHHLLCTGSVMFDVDANYGLVNGTHIDNHAGIFFDDNPVVMTDTAYNVILIPTLSITSTCHDTICHAGAIHCDAAFTTVNMPHYQWYINTTPAGTDSTGFTSSALVAGDSITCTMRTIMDDTVMTTSNILHITERALPYPGVISGTAVICPSATTSLSATVPGGTWSMSNSLATIAGGVVTAGSTSGIDTAIYTVTNICYPNSATYPVWIHPLADAGTISGYHFMCDTSSIILTDTVSGGHWYLSNSHASIASSGRVTGISSGNVTAYFHVTNMCSSDTVSFPIQIDSLIPVVVPSGLGSVCQGDSIALTMSYTGGVWTVSNSAAGITSSGVVTGLAAGTDTAIYTLGNACGSFPNPKVIIVNPTLVTSVTTSVMPATAICEGTVSTLTATPVNGGASPSYIWEKFGVAIGSGATLSYTPSVGDIVVCKMMSSALCPSADTVTSTSSIPVTPTVTPVISIIASPSDTVAYIGQLITFYATTTYGGSSPTYQWYVNSAPIPGATDISYNRVVSSNDTVYCEMTSSIACVTSNVVNSNAKIIYADYLSIHSRNINKTGMKLFPNPNKGNFTINGKSESNDEVGYQVLEVTGKVVHTGILTPSNGTINEQLNFTNTLVPGQYFVRMMNNSGVTMLHFVVE